MGQIDIIELPYRFFEEDGFFFNSVIKPWIRTMSDPLFLVKLTRVECKGQII